MFRSTISLGMLAALAVLATMPKAQSQSFLQPNTGTAGNWSTASLWSPALPTSGTSTALTFNILGGNTNAYTFTNDLGAFTANSLSFNHFGSGTFTVALGSNALTLDGTNPFFSLNGAGASVISGAGGVVLNANTSVLGSGNGSLNISSVISGGGSLTINQTGRGIFSLTGANTFTGGVTLQAGILQLGNATALGTGTLTVNGGSLRFSLASTIANNVTLNNTLTIANGTGILNATSSATLTGILSGNGGLSVIGYNTSSGVTLQGANTFTGAVTIGSALPNPTLADATGGILTLSGANGAIASVPAITVGSGGTLSLAGTATTANANRIGDTTPITLNGGRLTFNPGVAGTNETVGNLTISGLAHLQTTAAGISDLNFGTFTRSGNATMWLNSQSFGTINNATVATRVFFSGATSASMGVIAAGSGTGQEIGVIPYMVSSSTTNPRSFVTYDPTNGLQAIPFNNATYVLQQTPGAVSAATVLNKNVHFNGAGTYTLTGTNTINALTTTGSVVISGGTLQIASGFIVNWDPIDLLNTTLDFGSNPGYFHNSWNTQFSGTTVVTGSGGLVVTGNVNSRALVFDSTVDNTFSGGVTINGSSYYSIFREGHLGNASNNITIDGGGLSYNNNTNITIARNIALGISGGAFSFNQTTTGATAPTATATTAVTLSGVISGTGAFVKQGLGIVNLTGTNTYTGGTMVTGGTLQFTNDGNLGGAGSRIILDGGTLQALAAVSTSRPIDVNASSTINNANALTLTGPISNVGVNFGTGIPTMTKTGAGQLTIQGNSQAYTGALAVSAGSLTLSGSNGSLSRLTTLSIAAGSTATVDNSAAYNADRIGDFANISLGGAGSVFSYIAPTTVTTDPAERIGVLTNGTAGSVFSITGNAGATNGTILRFSSLNATASLTIRGDALGDAVLGPNVTRLLIDSLTTAQTILPNVFFANTAGTATSTIPAGYDLVRGIVQFTPTPVSGTSINNLAPDSVPLTAAYTTNGNATATTGVQVYSLVLDGGSTLTLNGGNAASGTNGNTPDGTLSLSGGILTSQNGSKTIDSAAARIVSFGAATGNVTTTSDLTLNTNVTLSGANGLTKNGAGTLTLNGPYAVTGTLDAAAGTIVFGQNATVSNLTGAGAVNIGTTTMTINSTAASTFTGQLAGTTGSLIKTGTGVFTLSPSAAATPTGGTTIGQGTLLLGNTNAANFVLSNPLTLGAGTTGGTLDLNGFSPSAALTSLATGGSSTANGITNSNTVTGSTVALNFAADATLPVQFGGNLTVNKNDSTTLTLTGNATLPATTTGVFNINAGTLLITGSGNAGIGNGMGITIANGAILRHTPTATGATGPYGVVTIIGTGEWQGTGANWFDPTVRGITMTGGRINYTGTNTAGTWINFLAAGSGGTGLITNASNIQAQILSTNTVDLLTGAAFTANIAQGTVPANGADVQIGIRQSLGFTKTGPGTLELMGNSTASTGAIVINQGTVRVTTASGTGAITVNNGGVLNGVGTLGGVATVNTGGFIQGGDPTTPTGTLTSSQNIILTNNGGIRATVNAAGADSLINQTGAANIFAMNPGAGNAFAISLVSDPASPMVNGTPYTVTLATLVTAGNFQLNGTSLAASTNIASSNFVLSSPEFTAFSAVSLDIDGAGTGLVLQFTPVPEPATIIGVGLLAVAGAGWVRRRRQAVVA
jgi:autotransporter-associated beta strand protein